MKKGSQPETAMSEKSQGNFRKEKSGNFFGKMWGSDNDGYGICVRGGIRIVGSGWQDSRAFGSTVTIKETPVFRIPFRIFYSRTWMHFGIFII
jgi:hypothetical protein